MHAAGMLRYAAAVALCVLFAGTADGQEGYGGTSSSSSSSSSSWSSSSASELIAPLMRTLPLKPGAAGVLPRPEVMPIPDVGPVVTNPTQPYEKAAPAEGGETYGTETPAKPVASAWYSGPATGSGSGNTKLDADGEPTDGLSTRAIANILKEHNVFRAREHVPPLRWNATVAGYAQRYAQERKGDCALEHSAGGPYGENLMYGTGKAWTWKHTVDEWSDEKKSYHYRSNSCDGGKMCGHYTAIVWKHTTDVGCGRVTCSSGDTLMVCSYWPPGNYIGEKPY